MALPDSQLDLLKAASGVLHDLQDTAQASNILVKEVTLVFGDRLVTFRWDEQAELYEISTPLTT